jgi:hypothetical protein
MCKSPALGFSTLLLLATVFMLTGCGVPDLPESLDVAVSGTERQAAPPGSGPAQLANSSWSLFRKADDVYTKGGDPAGPYGGLLNGGLLERPPVDQQMFLVDFGQNGEITAVNENLYFLPRIYGEDLPIGEEWIPTSPPIAKFRSASYGVQDGNRFGNAVVVQVRSGPIFMGRAILYSWGTIDGDRIDGTFGYLLDFSDGAAGIVLNSGGDQYPFYATRVTE